MPNRKAVISSAVTLDLNASEGMTDEAIRLESDEERFFQEYVKYSLAELADEARQYLLGGWSALGDKLSGPDLVQEVMDLDEPLTDEEFEKLDALTKAARPDLAKAVNAIGMFRTIRANLDELRKRQFSNRGLFATVVLPRVSRGAFNKARDLEDANR